jgi:hypothetical protein
LPVTRSLSASAHCPPPCAAGSRVGKSPDECSATEFTTGAWFAIRRFALKPFRLPSVRPLRYRH